MKTRLTRGALPLVRVVFGLMAVTLVTLLNGADVALGTFTPSTTVALSSSATSASADTTLTYSLPEGDMASSLLVHFTPGSSTVRPGPGHPSFIGGTHPALGDVVGTGTYTIDFGLTNGACLSSLGITFTLLNATVNNAVGNLVSGVPLATAGSTGTLESMWTDDGNAPGASPPPGAVAAVNGLPADVERYPAYLNTVLTPDGGSAIQPLARYVANQLIAGNVYTLNLVVLSAGALSAYAASNPLADMADSALGYPMLVFLHREDPTQDPTPSAITDSCSDDTRATTLYGPSRFNSCNGITTPPCNTAAGINSPTPGVSTGLNRYINPSSAGTYLWRNFHQSQRDADGDGYENSLDTCPLAVNTQNPHTTNGADGDMIDPACDPTPVADTGSGNHDADIAANGNQWLNALDNCPLVVNGTQTDTERGTVYTTAARRGGPRSDDIGDACEANDTVANGAFETTVSVVARCIGGTDADSDGWCSAAGGGLPADPNDASAAITPEAYSIFHPFPIAHSGSGAAPPQRQPVQVCNDGIDNDGDTFVDDLDHGAQSAPANTTNCRPTGLAATDTDGDGYSDEAEIHIGTDALGRCNVGLVPATSNDWPSDLVSVPSSYVDRIILNDLTAFLAPIRRLDSRPGDPEYSSRYDLVPGPSFGSDWIHITDVTALFAGTTGYPPMFGGLTRAFNGPACTAHPVYGD
jgi:hypothetical protein